MKTLITAFLFAFSLSAFAEGAFECHVKTGRRGAYAPEVAGALVVTDSHIVFSTDSDSIIFPTETREIKRWRGNSWIEFAINQADIRTRLAVDSDESMEKITIESMRGNTLVKIITYLCFQTR